MGETILVVDDDREITGAIAAALEREGYRVLRAYNGMEALDQALAPELRLIIMDVMMPRLDGLSALMRIRERRNLLREELKKSDDPVTRQALERRIRDLNQLYREGREVALVMERYYERGPLYGRVPRAGSGKDLSRQRIHRRSHRVEAGAQRGQQRADRAPASKSPRSPGAGADTPAAANDRALLRSGQDHDQNRPTAPGEQVHRVPNAGPGAGQTEKMLEIQFLIC